MPDFPSRPIIDVWAVLCDPAMPEEVGQRLLERQAAVRRGEKPEPCPEEDKPFLALHVLPERSGTEVPDA